MERSDSQNELDRAIVNVSSASLAVSMAIIKELSDLRAVIDLPLVFVSWTAFCIAIAFTVESYRRSIDEYGTEISNCYSRFFPRTVGDEG
jgi:hypothetical protein